MILPHITQSAGVIIISTALFNADRLPQCNLNVCDVFIVPERFEEGVPEANHFDILHHFLAQIVINPIDFLFLKHFADLFIQLLGRWQIISKRLLNHQTIPSAALQHAAIS
ncbi:hypothetical protein D3C74_414080 [compost metagenome]